MSGHIIMPGEEPTLSTPGVCEYTVVSSVLGRALEKSVPRLASMKRGRSAAIDAALGLKATKAYPEHVVQNIAIADPPSGAWTTKLEEAVERLRTLRGKRPRLAEEIRTLR